jgi:hypothetical protein
MAGGVEKYPGYIQENAEAIDELPLHFCTRLSIHAANLDRQSMMIEMANIKGTSKYFGRMFNILDRFASIRNQPIQ